MKLNTAIKQATQHLLDSDEARTYTLASDAWGKIPTYVIELEQSEDDRNILEVTTFGWDHERVAIPQTRPELIAMKCRAQLFPGGLNTIILRYCLDILRRESNG